MKYILFFSLFTLSCYSQPPGKGKPQPIPTPTPTPIVQEVDVLNWNSDHWATNDIFLPGQQDDRDPTGVSWFRGGDSTYSFNETGIMNMIGRAPRIYYYGNFLNVEAEMTYMKTNNEGKDSDGIIFGFRSDINGHSSNKKLLERSHTYYIRIRHDGKTDFMKEEYHGKKYLTYSSKIIFTNRLPINVWLTMKAKIYNTDLGIKLETYLNGELINEWIDNTDVPFTESGIIMIRNSDVYENSLYKDVTINAYA